MTLARATCLTVIALLAAAPIGCHLLGGGEACENDDNCPTGALCVPGLSHPSHWQAGAVGFGSASALRRVRMPSNNFELRSIESHLLD